MKIFHLEKVKVNINNFQSKKLALKFRNERCKTVSNLICKANFAQFIERNHASINYLRKFYYVNGVAFDVSMHTLYRCTRNNDNFCKIDYDPQTSIGSHFRKRNTNYGNNLYPLA